MLFLSFCRTDEARFANAAIEARLLKNLLPFGDKTSKFVGLFGEIGIALILFRLELLFIIEFYRNW